MPSNHLILCHSLLLPPSIFPRIRVFSNVSVLHIRWPKYWSLIFNIARSNEYLGLISFRIDWLDLLAVQGTLKSFLQHHNSKASILGRSALFTNRKNSEKVKRKEETPVHMPYQLPRILHTGIHLSWVMDSPPARTPSHSDWPKTTRKLTQLL